MVIKLVPLEGLVQNKFPVLSFHSSHWFSVFTLMNSELLEVFHVVLKNDEINYALTLFLLLVFWFFASNILDHWTEYWIMT